MSRTASFPARRRSELLELLRHRGQATIKELAQEFDVSEDTIRRDLDDWASQGLLERNHGGASLPTADRLNIAPPFGRRLDAQADAKSVIARAASSLIAEGETLFINGGTTTLALAKHLAGVRGITVVTNNLPLPEHLYAAGAREVYVLGGSFRVRSLVTIGPVALPDGNGGVQTLHADTAFIGVGGVSADGTVTTTSLPEAGMMRAMMAASNRTILLADSTKFGVTQFAEICQLSKDTTLVTDVRPSRELLDVAVAAECRILVASEMSPHP